VGPIEIGNYFQIWTPGNPLSGRHRSPKAQQAREHVLKQEYEPKAKKIYLYNLKKRGSIYK